MELQAIDVRAGAICLIPAVVRPREVLRPKRQVERLTVPVENGLRSGESGEEPVRSCRFSEANRRETDLFHRIWVHPRSECLCDQLRAEAYAQYRKTTIEGLSNARDLPRDPRQIVIDRHRSAHQNETGE